jgi:GTPase SAR1 family protein
MHDYRIMLVGNNNTGKSAFLRRYIQGKNTYKYKESKKIKTKSKIISIYGNNMTIRITEIPGSLCDISFAYDNNCGIIIFCDILNEESMSQIYLWRKKFNNNKNVILLCNNNNNIEYDDKIRRICDECNINNYFIFSIKDSIYVDTVIDYLVSHHYF